MKTIRIGTRGSDLALVQAAATERALADAFPEALLERVVIKTTGDRRTDVALSEVAKVEGVLDKGVFTKELEIALAANEVDIAVHSLKDVPTVVDAAFEIVGTLERAPVRDVLVMREAGGVEALAPGSKVGTSSVRRAKQLLWLRPDLEILDIRGNVPTRLKKLANGGYDAIMLAEAGLIRLGYPMEDVCRIAEQALYFAPIAEDQFFPAAGQGAIGFEIRADDDDARGWVAAISHADTFLRARAEREFLRLIDGGCHTPVGVFSSLVDGHLEMLARLFPDEGGEPQTAQASGSDPFEVARELYQSLE
jgi:hydroxymethylbilane synthase